MRGSGERISLKNVMKLDFKHFLTLETGRMYQRQKN